MTDTPAPTATPAAPSQNTPAATATATATFAPGGGSCPGVPVTCPAVPACKTGNRLGKTFYAYPSAQRIVTSSGFFQLNPASNGIDPVAEGGSLAMVDQYGATILQMPHLDFQAVGSGFVAQNDQGSVSIAPATNAANAYNFQFEFDQPNLPPGYFSVYYYLCLSVGDDGIYEQIVCQQKPHDGFLCHNNGPTLF